MTQWVEFEEIKKQYSLLDVAGMLRLALKKEPTTYRGECPQHTDADRRKFVLTPDKGDYGAFFCAVSRKGGYDCIALVAHVLDCSQKEAAIAIQKHFGNGTGTSKGTSRVPTEPESVASKGTQKPQLEAYFDKLDSDHPAVDALGFSAEFARKHRIGFAKSGVIGDTVAIPFRDENGTLLGFIGVIDCKLPADFTPNVVQLRKPA